MSILRATCVEAGDGWKDKKREGDVAFVYSWQLGAPYAPGQHLRVGNPIWSIQRREWRLESTTLWERLKLWRLVRKDRRDPEFQRQYREAKP